MQRQILISATSYPDYYDVDFIVGNSKFIGSVNINLYRKRNRYHLSYMVGGKIFHEYFKDFQSIIDSFLESKFL